MIKKSGSFAIACVCVLLGLMMTLQIKSVSRNAMKDNSQLARADQLQVALNAEQDKNEALYAQLIEYANEVASFKEEASTTGGYAQALAERLDRIEILAGVTQVGGPGVTVVMRDSTKLNTTGADENYFIIHDEDILKIINELRAAGAEAISLNGERIVATSEIRCAGPTVSVNNTKYAAPYTIKAIGDPDTMERALLMRQGIVDVLTQWGIEIEVKKETHIDIAGYTGIGNFKYATSAKGTEKAK